MTEEERAVYKPCKRFYFALPLTLKKQSIKCISALSSLLSF